MRWLQTFNRVAAGSLAILLTSCTSLKPPKTLFITYQVDQRDFQVDRARVRSILNKYAKAFQRSNPETRIVYITYTSREFINQLEKDSRLNLGPDLILIHNYYAPELLARGLTTTPADTKYFDEIYSPRTQATAKANSKYIFAPWIIETQIACFNNTSINESPSTIQELEELSASGKKIGLASNAVELIWTAGTQGAISEISALGNPMTAQQANPAIRKWLQWLRKAALYKNIFFLKEYKDLKEKLLSNELDWVTCWSTDLEDLKKKMGNNLGVAALPDGSTSKALPVHAIYGFALGKNSSPAQRKKAMKFIKTHVNTVAQRKLQLDDVGFLAANQNVSIPAKSSQKLSAINTSFNEQSNFYSSEWPGILNWFEPEKRNSKNYGKRYPEISRTLTELTDGYLSVEDALKAITTTPTN